MPWKKWPSRSPSGPPPDTAWETFPPMAFRSLLYTSLSNTECLSFRTSPTLPGCRAREYSMAVSAARWKMAPLPPSSALVRAEL